MLGGSCVGFSSSCINLLDPPPTAPGEWRSGRVGLGVLFFANLQMAHLIVRGQFSYVHAEHFHFLPSEDAEDADNEDFLAWLGLCL